VHYFRSTLQRFDLAIEAALVWIRLVERSAVQRFVLGHRQLRREQIDLNAVFIRDAVAQIERLLKLISSF
jgi:hypothetical protein